MNQEYIGRVCHVALHGDYGFIKLASVTKPDGSAHDLATNRDIYVHRSGLRLNMELRFEVEPDTKREQAFRIRFYSETQASKLEMFAEHGGITLDVQTTDGTFSLEHAMPFVKWRFSPEVIERIKTLRLEGRTVAVLLCYWKDGKEKWDSTEHRVLAQIDAPMTILSFDAPGRHNILATIVHHSSWGQLEDWLLRRDSGHFKTDVLRSDRTDILLEERTTVGHVRVEIPEGLFAPKPRDYGWVTLILKDPSDQCALRRYRMFAYTIQIPLVGIFWTIMGAIYLCGATLAVLMLSAGYRPNWDALRHPNQSEFGDIFKEAHNSIFLPKVRDTIFYPCFMTSPLTLSLCVGLGWISGFGFLKGSLICFGLGTLFTTFIFLINLYTNKVGWDAKKATRAKEERARFEIGVAEEMSRLANVPAGKPDPWSLPVRFQTVRFFFLGTKQVVCKPFAE